MKLVMFLALIACVWISQASCLTTSAVILTANYPIISKWQTNPTNIQQYNVTAGVLGIKYNSTYVYITTNSVPLYSIGPWKNPNTPKTQNLIVAFKLTPTYSNTTKTYNTLGAIGVWINGVTIYNSWDAILVNSIWHRSALYYEGRSFDSCNGHPDQSGTYHNHVHILGSKCYANISSSSHSPLLGFMLDSYPIYGPYGYASAYNASSDVRLMESSFSLRTTNYATRNSLPSVCYSPANSLYGCGSTNLPTAFQGPSFNSTYPLGSLLEDYDYFTNIGGDLDQYNGRWCVTPEYPGGTYAYFVTVNSTGSGVFPYNVAYSFFGSTSGAGIATSYPTSYSTFY